MFVVHVHFSDKDIPENLELDTLHLLGIDVWRCVGVLLLPVSLGIFRL